MRLAGRGERVHNAAVVKTLHRIGWIGLTLVGALLLLASLNDLRADRGTGLPVDHAGTLSTLAGSPFASVRHSAPGVARFLTTLEVGYALHELTFVVLFLAVVLLPLRRRQRWAWWASWAVMVATLGYTFTVAWYDPTVRDRSLVADIATPLLLLACAPAVFAGVGQSTAGPADEQR